MPTLVRLAPGRPRAAIAALMAEYLAFDRQRRANRPLIHAFSAFAVVVLGGGALGRVPRVESVEAASVLVAPVCALLALNAWRSARLRRRLSDIQAEIQRVNS